MLDTVLSRDNEPLAKPTTFAHLSPEEFERKKQLAVLRAKIAPALIAEQQRVGRLRDACRQLRDRGVQTPTIARQLDIGEHAVCWLLQSEEAQQ